MDTIPLPLREWITEIETKGFVVVDIEENTMAWNQESDEVIVTEPIQPKKDCKVEIAAAEAAQWTVKSAGIGGAPGHEGEVYKAVKLTLTITDENVTTEHENARPRLTVEHQFNIERYPYLDKKTGQVKWLGRANLYDLEEALGFDPCFFDAGGNSVEAFITRTGRKAAPKGEGVTRKPNPAFLSAYFNSDGTPNLEWSGKTVYADIGIEVSEQFGDKNRISRFKKAPISV